MQNMTMRNETEVPETSQNATCTESNAFETGCEKRVTNYLDVWFHPVTVGVIVILSIQVSQEHEPESDFNVTNAFSNS